MGGGGYAPASRYPRGKGGCGTRTIEEEENDLLSLAPHLGSRQAESVGDEVGERVRNASCNPPCGKRLPDVQRC
jgi:hypothetical protein